MLNTTSYQRQFGERPKAEEEFLVLKTKKFSKLEISTFFKNDVKVFIEQWITHGQSDTLISSLYFTARDLFTFIKQAQTANTSYSHFFYGKRAEKVPRFDQILLKNKIMTSQNGKANTDSKLSAVLRNNLSLESI